jgi:hypothetical protein
MYGALTVRLAWLEKGSFEARVDGLEKCWQARQRQRILPFGSKVLSFGHRPANRNKVGLDPVRLISTLKHRFS